MNYLEKQSVFIGIALFGNKHRETIYGFILLCMEPQIKPVSRFILVYIRLNIKIKPVSRFSLLYIRLNIKKLFMVYIALFGTLHKISLSLHFFIWN